MAFSLSVCKIVSFIIVKCQTKLALEGTKVIFHEIRVLDGQNRFTLERSMLSSASCCSRSRRAAASWASVVHPPPVFDILANQQKQK